MTTRARRSSPQSRTLRALSLVAAVVVLAAGCGSRAGDPRASGSGSPSAAPSGPQPQVAAPAALTKPLRQPDLLVQSGTTIPPSTLAAIDQLKGVTTVESFSMAQLLLEGHQVTYAAVDPTTFRRWTPPGSAQTLQVWTRVAAGEMAIGDTIGKQVQDSAGYVRMGNQPDAPRIHIGAYAEMVPRLPGDAPYIDAVVNQAWADRLGMAQGNALLISTGETAPKGVYKKLTKLLGESATARVLGPNLDTNATLTAVLSGGSLAAALGTLRYTPTTGGRVVVDPAWVSRMIRTEEVPIIGKVTCNKVMLPELKAALTEVVQRGLADKIHPGEYGGCFVPRYIANTQELSFHTFGTAIDLNVPGNQRGTVGQMDPQVVAIFKKWGFAWGGDWGYTDPMHFELHQLVEAKPAKKDD